MTKLNHKKIQQKWIKKWNEAEIFKAKPDEREKFYLTVAYPYPSGSMHVGHARTYTVPDVIARFKRMQGKNVLFPMAWHVTGSPVLGIAKRIAKGDEKALWLYGDLYKVPEETLKSFTDPNNIVKYFSDEYRRNMTYMGFSIDWSREFLTITPQYSKFIEWQYRRLKEKGLVRKGEHPVRYCPSCDNPVGDHDLLAGENAKINEFSILKFKVDDIILPAATLRPETIFGVTNMWLNPEVVYQKVKVGDEVWLLSKEAAEKLKYQSGEIEVIGEAGGEELIGKDCLEPINNKKIPILAASFVDPNYATGVVMSVPAHAPYDYVALQDLKSDLEIPVIIETKKYKDKGEKSPAQQIVEQMGVKKQDDPLLEKATDQMYKDEHAKGVMVKGIEKYGGMGVGETRKKLISDMELDIFYEFSESPVTCRCNTNCVIKILKDQWFIRYGDEKWKKKVHECLEQMRVVPGEEFQNFEHVIDWLEDWACTRRVGLGTHLPWDKEWLIEPLSDSTIYMAYYTIAHHLREIEPEKLDDDFFDFIFYGKKKIREKVNEILKIKEEFNYWYPGDLRLSAKDLVGNHLTFHMFHHTALFPPEKWTRGFVVFGMGLLEGNKMSSSKGNVVLLGDAINEYGSDTIRLFLMSNAEPWQDFDWRKDLVKNTAKKLRQFYNIVNWAAEMGEKDMGGRDIDGWLLSRMQHSIRRTTEALENFQTRKALQCAFFEVINDFNWYSRRAEPNPGVLREFSGIWVSLMAPFTPFICEELWEKTGGENFVSDVPYPVYDENRVNDKIEVQEEMLADLIETVQDFKGMIEKHRKPEKAYLYLAPRWKRDVFEQIKEGKQMGEIMQNPQLRAHGKEIARIMKSKRDIPAVVLTLDEEHRFIVDAKSFLEKEFNLEIEIQEEVTHDPEGKAQYASPMKLGVYIE
ncbi:MAG: leucine--tRNA ligase [Candidatus Altiarchaeales archaeon WOR_SM1_86-2]|nr:MAG: leucine--tRNA ligase [Candidatus Altiarchaeales archaeon WOR_SM1_86-2]ODS40578.1 MAG: leucine--tRNA ligase [Candidatus Altiarchaeales archaeon WOR_SM1_79]